MSKLVAILGYVSAATIIVGLATTEGQVQQRALTADEVERIIRAGPEDDLQIPEIIAALYGPRAKRGLEALLNRPSSRESFLLQLSALTTAQYPRVGIKLDILKDYASGNRLSSLPTGLAQILRTRAFKALSTQPDPELRDFWLQLRSHPVRLYRQFVPFGLACAVGLSSLPDLEQLRQGTDTALRRQAEKVTREFAAKGALAQVCGGATRDDAPQYPQTLPPALTERSERLRREIP